MLRPFHFDEVLQEWWITLDSPSLLYWPVISNYQKPVLKFQHPSRHSDQFAPTWIILAFNHAFCRGSSCCNCSNEFFLHSRSTTAGSGLVSSSGHSLLDAFRNSGPFNQRPDKSLTGNPREIPVMVGRNVFPLSRFHVASTHGHKRFQTLTAVSNPSQYDGAIDK